MTAKNLELGVFNPFDESQVGSVKINNANEIEEMLELGERIGDVKEERWRSRSQEFINKLPIVIF